MGARVAGTWTSEVQGVDTDYRLVQTAVGSYTVERHDSDSRGGMVWTSMGSFSTTDTETPWTGVPQVALAGLLAALMTTRSPYPFTDPNRTGTAASMRAVRTGALETWIERKGTNEMRSEQWALVATVGDAGLRPVPRGVTRPLLAALIQSLV